MLEADLLSKSFARKLILSADTYLFLFGKIVAIENGHFTIRTKVKKEAIYKEMLQGEETARI